MTTEQQEIFDSLKQKGWANLSTDERAQYQELKALATPKKEEVKKEAPQASIAPDLLEDLNKKLSILTKAVDLNKLDDAEKKMFEEQFPQKEQFPIIRLNFWEGELVTSWRTTKDIVKVRNGDVIEDQTLELTLEGDRKIELPYRDFNDLRAQKVYECSENPVKVTRDGKVHYEYKVIYTGFNEDEKPKPITINDKFIN